MLTNIVFFCNILNLFSFTLLPYLFNILFVELAKRMQPILCHLLMRFFNSFIWVSCGSNIAF